MIELLEFLAHLIDFLACTILIIGLIFVTASSLPMVYRAYRNESSKEFYNALRFTRLHLGQVLLLGLEVLIVSDILYSVLHRTIDEMAILGITVLIRIALSHFLNVELNSLENSARISDES